ncbi:hypothetical protein [Aeromonas phage 1233]|nr:hypothetical protein [Aeromonas phage 1233]
MAEDYILVRLDNNIRDKAVLIYDAAKDLITDSGLVALDGDIQAAAGSVKVGLQTMSSAGEQVTWTNQNSLVTYAPPWHIVDDTNPGGSYDRFYGPTTSVVRFADRSSVVINPVMNVTIPIDTLALAFNFTWPEAQEGVVFEWFDTLDHPAIWRDVRNVSQGTHDEVFPTPLAYRAGNYVFKMYRLDGQPLKVMGNPNTGYAGYDVKYREFTEKRLATQEYVVQAVATGGTGIPTANFMLKTEYDPDGDGSVNLADKLKGADAAPATSYYGKDPAGQLGFHALPQGDAAAAQIEQNKQDIIDLQTAVNNAARQAATTLSAVNANTSSLNSLSVKQSADRNDINALKASKADGLTASVNHTNKTITITLTAQGRTIDTDTIDLSSWFSTGPVPQDFRVYAGFTAKTAANVTEADVLSGTFKDANVLDGLDISISRADTTPNYIWCWIPDIAGSVTGFEFSGFVSTWAATALAVQTIDGKLYMSPNLTSTTDVTFEVKA